MAFHSHIPIIVPDKTFNVTGVGGLESIWGKGVQYRLEQVIIIGITFIIIILAHTLD